MKRIVTIILSACIGSAIGTLLAQHMHYWQIATIIGGITGWIVCDFNQIKKAIPKWIEYVKDEFYFFDFNEALDCAKKWLMGLYAVGILIGAFFMGKWLWDTSVFEISLNPTLVIAGVCMIIIVELMCILNLADEISIDSGDQRKDVFRKAVLKVNLYSSFKFAEKSLGHLWLMLTISPVLAVWLIINLLWILVPKLIKLSFKLTWKLIILIHSNNKLVAGTGAFVGGMIAHYFKDNVFIGVLAGGIAALLIDTLASRIARLLPATKTT